MIKRRRRKREGNDFNERKADGGGENYMRRGEEICLRVKVKWRVCMKMREVLMEVEMNEVKNKVKNPFNTEKGYEGNLRITTKKKFPSPGVKGLSNEKPGPRAHLYI